MSRCLAAALVAVAVWPLSAAQDETRQIWDSGFRQKRPPAAKAANQPPADHRVDYRVDGVSPPASALIRLVGFTVWRLREPVRGDETSARLLVQDKPGQGATEYVPERLQESDVLRVGDRVRLGIEVPRAGYLYVIDRERYADGTTGAPHLIFPARNLRGGDNRVEPGRLVEIPAQGDPVPALRVARRDERQIAEELLILVTEAPMASLIADTRERELPADLVTGWEQKWGGPTSRLDLVGAAPRSAWTAAEKAAGLDERLLTQVDPMPASLYQIEARGDVALFKVLLSVRP